LEDLGFSVRVYSLSLCIYIPQRQVGPVIPPGINNWMPIALRPIGRTKNRWDDDVRKDQKIMRVCNWKDCVKDRNKWKSVVEQVKTLMEL
jgi:hypothetical protein